MTLELTEQQSQLVESHGSDPIEVIDPDTKRAYVMIAREQFDKIRPILYQSNRAKTVTEVDANEISPQMLRSQQAFWRELPELLLRRKWQGQWVCYYGDERIGIARDTPELVQRCLQRGLQRGDFYIDLIEEKAVAPWVCEPMDEPLFELTDE